MLPTFGQQGVRILAPDFALRVHVHALAVCSMVHAFSFLPWLARRRVPTRVGSLEQFGLVGRCEIMT